MTSHFKKWCHNYHEYIEEWYPMFVSLFTEEKMKIPTKKDFYWHCYKNSCPEIGELPEIIPTPEVYMDWFSLEQYMKFEKHVKEYDEIRQTIMSKNKNKNSKNIKNQNHNSFSRCSPAMMQGGHSSVLTSRTPSILTHSSLPRSTDLFRDRPS